MHGLSGPGPLLACGADPVDLLAQVGDGLGARLSAHQQECRHCREALAEDQHLWAPFDEMSAEPVRAPPGLLERAFAYVRQIAADPHTTLLPLDEAGPGGRAPGTVPGLAWVGARVVLRSARLAAEEVRGVRMALSHLGVDPPVRPGGPAVVVVAMTVAADYGQDLHALAGRVRTRVVERVEALTGVRADAVSVHIDEVLR